MAFGYNLNGIDIPMFPADPIERAINGRMYYNTTSKKVRIYTDGSWGDLVVPGSTGANTTLSNLTSPVAINQNLLPSSDNTRNIGTAITDRFKAGSFVDSVSVGRYPFGAATPGAAVVDGATPGLYVYNGGADAYNVVADAGSGVSIQNPGAGVSLLNVQNHQFIFKDSTSGDNYLEGGMSGILASTGLEINTTTGALILPRMSTADRDALTAVNGMEIYNSDTDKFQAYEDGAWVDVIGGAGSGASQDLSNLTNPTAINQPLNDSSGNASLDLTGRTLTNSNGTSVSYGNDTLKDSFSGTDSVSYGQRSLVDSASTIALNWDNRRAIYPDGVTTAIEWSNDVTGVKITGNLIPSATDESATLGSPTNVWGTFYGDVIYAGQVSIPGTALIDFNTGSLEDTPNGQSIQFTGANRVLFDVAQVNSINWSTRVISDSNGTSIIDYNTPGLIKVPTTISVGTGNKTINQMSGTVNFAAAATTLTVTNSLVNTNSLIFATVRTNDTTAQIKNVVASSGSFVITLSAAATATTSVGFIVFNG